MKTALPAFVSSRKASRHEAPFGTFGTAACTFCAFTVNVLDALI